VLDQQLLVVQLLVQVVKQLHLLELGLLASQLVLVFLLLLFLSQLQFLLRCDLSHGGFIVLNKHHIEGLHRNVAPHVLDVLLNNLLFFFGLLDCGIGLVVHKLVRLSPCLNTHHHPDKRKGQHLGQKYNKDAHKYDR